MSSAMEPPSPRPAMRRKRWYTIEDGESYGMQMPVPSTPRQTPSEASSAFDAPPLSVVVIESTPTEQGWDGPASDGVTDAFFESPFRNVSQLKPRRPLPVTSTCVSPYPTDRKRSASSIASSSIDESTVSYSSPMRAGPRLPSLPMSSVTPSRESSWCSVKHQDSPSRCSLRPQHSPKDVDFMALESLSLQSPVARKPCAASTPSPPSKLRERDHTNPLSDYIASPARSRQSCFSDYVGSPSLKPRAPSFDSSGGGSCSGYSPSPARKVRLKVITQNVCSNKGISYEPTKFTTPILSRTCKHQSSTSLAYSMDGSDGSSNDHSRSPPPSRPPLPMLADEDNPMFSSRDLTVTPRSVRQPNYSPCKVTSKTTLLSPRTPLPKIRLTPRKSPHTKTNIGLMPRKPIPHLFTPSPPQDSLFEDDLDEPLSFGGSSLGLQEVSSSSKSTYNVSPRKLFPQPGSQFYPPSIHNKSSNGMAGMDVSFTNHSVEPSVGESLRSNMSYMSDSEDEDEFVLASPATLKEEAARHYNKSDRGGKRLTKLPRR